MRLITPKSAPSAQPSAPQLNEPIVDNSKQCDIVFSDSEDSDTDFGAWREVTTDGMIYYWNEETGETSWDLPTNAAIDNTVGGNVDKGKSVLVIPSNDRA